MLLCDVIEQCGDFGDGSCGYLGIAPQLSWVCKCRLSVVYCGSRKKKCVSIWRMKLECATNICGCVTQ